MKFKRLLMPILEEAIKEFPAVFIAGARQVGKSTLVMEISDNYVTFDDINAYLSAKNDPVRFINTLKIPVVLDEVQKVPEIFNVLKQKIDENKKANQFLLTGSINLLRFSNVKESLTGRLIIFDLFPLSIYEILNQNGNLIENLFSGKFLGQKSSQPIDIFNFIFKGGFPEVHKIRNDKMRYIWLSSYISTYLEKDVMEFGEVRNIDKFLNLIHILASYSGNILNKSKLSQTTGIDNKTLDYYLNLLQLIYQITVLRPFSQNIGKRFIKSPKIYLNDTGLLCYLLGISSKDEMLLSSHIGMVLETFVFNELLKHSKYSLFPVEIYFYRTFDKREIDFIVKYKNELIAIEVKNKETVSEKDFKNIKEIKGILKYGIVFYNGIKVLPFDKNLYAVPLKSIFNCFYDRLSCLD